MTLPTVHRIEAVVELVSFAPSVGVVLAAAGGVRYALVATEAQVERALALRHGAVSAIFTRGESARLVAIAPAGASSAMSAEARTELFTQRWARTLERLGR